MLKIKVVFLFVVGLIFILGIVSQRHALACELIEYSSYSAIAPDVYVSPLFKDNENEQLLSLVREGKSRVDNTFGNTISTPKIIIAATNDEASEFGSNAYGRAHLTPLSQCLVFGPNGHNIDVIAHEYTHAEVHYRVGWFEHYLNIHIWFNEGVALLVDYRKPYLIANIELSETEVQAVKAKGLNFFDGKNVIKNYQAARIAIDSLDKSSLYNGLEKIKEGKSFKEVFTL